MRCKMEIRNLMSFVQVAELNSFTKAARVLGYSQSTISFQIKQLESELDCLLFERINNTITLTDKGYELADRITKEAIGVQSMVDKGITDEELTAFYSTLEKLYANFASLSSGEKAQDR